MLEDDAHSLCLGAEGEVGENLILLYLLCRVFYLNVEFLPLQKLHAKRVGKSHQRHFVRRRSLKFLFLWLVLIGIYGRHVMAETQS